jgi:hypothetical protein
MKGRRRKEGPLPVNREPRAACQSCKAWIIWAVTERGRRMPVDAQMNIGGTLVLCYEVDELDRPTSGQMVLQAPADYRGPKWISHFATCPKASAWRRSQGERGEA